MVASISVLFPHQTPLFPLDNHSYFYYLPHNTFRADRFCAWSLTMKCLKFITVIILIPVVCLSQMQVWSQTYAEAWVGSLTKGNNGEFVSVGYVPDEFFGTQGFMWSLDLAGNTLWDQVCSPGMFLSDVVSSNDGGYIAVGNFFGFTHWHWMGWILSVDGSGGTLWNQFFSDPQLLTDYELYTVCRDTNGDFVAGGIGENNDTLSVGKAWVLKFNDQGDTLWSRLHDFGYYSIINAVSASSAGGMIAAGNWVESAGDPTYSPFLVRYDDNGDTLWTRLYDFPQNTIINDIVEDPQGGFVGVGSTEDQYYPINNGFFAHFDDSGDTLDFMVYSSDLYTGFSTVAYCPQDRWVMAGMTTIDYNYQAYLQYCEEDGSVIWSAEFGGAGDDRVNDIEICDDGGIICCGNANYTMYYSDGWIFKVDTTQVGVSPEFEPSLPQSMQVSVHPNPFNGVAIIRYHIDKPGDVKLSLYDTQGRLISTLYQGHNLPGNYTSKLSAENLSSGVYIVRLQCGSAVKNEKIVLLR